MPFSYRSLYFDRPPIPKRALDIWFPQQQIQPLTLVFVHGGGWHSGQRDQMHTIMWGFLEKGYICVSLDYRLDGTTIPTQLSDVREGMTLVNAQLQEQGITHPFVLYGSSAGGHLALLAGLAPSGACGDHFRGETPAMAGIVASCAPVTLEPWEEIFPGSKEAFHRAVGISFEECPEAYKRVSPEHYISAQSPPTFFLLGECEHMFPNALTITVVERLRALGASSDYRVYSAAEHGFFYSFERDSQKKAFEEVLSFLTSIAS